MGRIDLNNTDEEADIQQKLIQYEKEIRKLKREVVHLKNAVSQEKIAYTTILNQQKASTFLQRQRERYLTLLLANSPSIILFLSQTGRVEFCTEYFISKTGHKNAAEVMGYTLTEVLSPFLGKECLEDLLNQSDDVIQSNAPASFDIAFRFNQESEEEEFAGILVPMKDETQHTNGIMLMFHDVTDLKRSREEALAASKAKSSFLSNMSHEIRTPMNAIIGMTSIGKREKTTERKDYALEKIESASTHLLGVINDVLDISKIESGKMELYHVDFSFSAMLERVMSVIMQRIQDKKLKFSMEIDPAVPDFLFGDDQRLAQVVTNILSNAAKFTPEEGSIDFCVNLLDLQANKCLIQMSVKDTGIGLTKEAQSKLFNIFQQAEAGTTRKYGGSGLGLAISKRILELMNGQIWVESEPGKGSCFYFTVCLGISDRQQSGNAIAAEPEIAKDEGYVDFTGKTVLLVDDIDINLEIAMAILEPTNLTIDTAKSGGEAFDIFAANPGRYDLILMDMQMPGVDGLEATKMIRALATEEALNIPIIAMTANVFKEDIEKCVEAGMNAHLGKPIDTNDVMKMLSQYL